MSRAIPLSAIKKAVLDGIVDAAGAAGEQFGMWLNELPEYYVTARVADRLAKTLGDQGWVHLEQQRSTVLKSAKAELRGRRSRAVPKKARFDLTAYYSNETPRAIIEIKSPVYVWNDAIQRDVDRLCDALNRTAGKSPLQCGVLGWYTDATIPDRKDTSATSRVRRYLDEWEKQVKACVSSHEMRVEFARSKVSRVRHGSSDQHEAWAAWVAMIRK
ncbi:MAG: hypothetical protein IPG63_07550 [Xanthomonadales bacterium]|nr:hypothetical protein [Xanthomonadales bacterium]